MRVAGSPAAGDGQPGGSGELAVVTVTTERAIAGGDALAHLDDGRVLFVRGALAGERVDVAVTEERRDWARGDVVTVHEPAPGRVEPPCPQRRAGCGGCDWQHVARTEQPPAKLSIVRDALRRTARLDDVEITWAGSVPTSGYRTTLRVVGTDDARAGFRMQRSHRTVPAAGCLVAHPALAELLDDLVVPPGLEVTLRVSVATAERVAFWRHGRGEVVGLPPDVTVGRSAAISEQVAGRTLRVSAPSFFQSGPAAAELLAGSVGRLAGPMAGRRVLDLYGGIGVFAATAAADAAEVVVVDSSSSAVADARHNLRQRKASVLRSDAARWRARRRSFDVVIADPPRSGLGQAGVEAVVSAGAPTLVLVSCDPVSLARDARLLAGHGFGIELVEALDPFPHTHHVETVTRFTRPSRGSSS